MISGQTSTCVLEYNTRDINQPSVWTTQNHALVHFHHTEEILTLLATSCRHPFMNTASRLSPPSHTLSPAWAANTGTSSWSVDKTLWQTQAFCVGLSVDTLEAHIGLSCWSVCKHPGKKCWLLCKFFSQSA